MGIGKNLKSLAKEKNMTLKEIAKKAGVSVNTLYTITDRDPESIRSSTLEKISEALDIEPYKLFAPFDSKNAEEVKTKVKKKIKPDWENAFMIVPLYSDSPEDDEITNDEVDYSIPIGKKIAYARHINGLKQYELANKLNITAAALSEIENGDNITWKRLLKIADAIGCSVIDIIKEKGEKNGKSQNE